MNLFNLFTKKPNVKTHKDCIKYHLQKYGSITLKQAINLYGISYLSGHISQLMKDDDMDIYTERRWTTNKLGVEYSYLVYINDVN